MTDIIKNLLQINIVKNAISNNLNTRELLSYVAWHDDKFAESLTEKQKELLDKNDGQPERA